MWCRVVVGGWWSGYDRAMRLVILLCFVPFITGWFCISIPMGVFAPGNTCAGEDAFVGQRLTNTQTGRSGTIKELHGRSGRCQDGKIPVLATVDYE